MVGLRAARLVISVARGARRLEYPSVTAVPISRLLNEAIHNAGNRANTTGGYFRWMSRSECMIVCRNLGPAFGSILSTRLTHLIAHYSPTFLLCTTHSPTLCIRMRRRLFEADGSAGVSCGTTRKIVNLQLVLVEIFI